MILELLYFLQLFVGTYFVTALDCVVTNASLIVRCQMIVLLVVGREGYHVSMSMPLFFKILQYVGKVII